MTRHRTTTASRGTASPKPDPVEVAATALAAVGPVTAAQLATHLGVAYPSITPRLRRLETDGRAERIKEPATGRTLWHATPPTNPPTPGTPTSYDGAQASPITPRAKPPPIAWRSRARHRRHRRRTVHTRPHGAPHRPTSRVHGPRRGPPTCRRRLTDSHVGRAQTGPAPPRQHRRRHPRRDARRPRRHVQGQPPVDSAARHQRRRDRQQPAQARHRRLHHPGLRETRHLPGRLTNRPSPSSRAASPGHPGGCCRLPRCRTHLWSPPCPPPR